MEGEENTLKRLEGSGRYIRKKPILHTTDENYKYLL
jgi:hypothetical protein